MFKRISNHKTHFVSEETKRKISESEKGKFVSPETRLKLSLSHKGNIPKCHFKKGHIPWNKGLPSTKKGTHYSEQERINHLKSIKRGKDCHFWRGGVCSENERLRKSVEYKLWRTSVFERDNYTCIWCGQHGGRLHPDHIKPWSLYPELRFAIDNGRTLCIKCHMTTDTYGVKMNKNIKADMIAKLEEVL